jgi:hypothetical protein
MNTEFATIASMFNTNARAFDKAIQGVPADKWLVCPSNLDHRSRGRSSRIRPEPAFG